jgi:hypothetical protein
VRPISKESFESPSTASDGIQEIDVTDDSMRIGGGLAVLTIAEVDARGQRCE